MREHTKVLLGGIRSRYEDEATSPVKTGARSVPEKNLLRGPSYEPLKHFFKIYINNFPGAKELRAKLMETHSVAEARAVLSQNP